MKFELNGLDVTCIHMQRSSQQNKDCLYLAGSGILLAPQTTTIGLQLQEWPVRVNVSDACQTPSHAIAAVWGWPVDFWLNLHLAGWSNQWHHHLQDHSTALSSVKPIFARHIDTLNPWVAQPSSLYGQRLSCALAYGGRLWSVHRPPLVVSQWYRWLPEPAILHDATSD